MVNDGKTFVYVAVWLFLQTLLFVLAFVNYAVSDNFKGIRGRFGLPLLVARASAMNLHVSSGIILFPVCRTILTWLRSTPLNHVVPFDASISFHKLCGYTIAFFTLVHVVAHVFNYMVLAAESGSSWVALWFGNGPGWTGNIMLLCLILLFFTAGKSVRRRRFEAFWYTHHLFIPFFAFFAFHGTFCLLKPDRPPYCAQAGSFWKYWIASGTLYLAERLARELRSRRAISVNKVILHPSQVVEIQLHAPFIKAKAGQYLFLCCPEISPLQWHPFTLTSAPEEDYISVHVRLVGDWTTQLATRLGCDSGLSEDEKVMGAEEVEEEIELGRTLPRFLIDGPFGSASEDVFKYEVAVLVGAGIGVTPFASVLKSIWYRVSQPKKSTKLHKVYFFWVCRDYRQFEWFQDLLKAIEEQDLDHFLEIHVYLTGRLQPDEIKNVIINNDDGYQDALTGLRAATNYGRPNLDQIFTGLRRSHEDSDLGVFFCGPKPLGRSLKAACTKYSQSGDTGTRFFYNKENF